MNAENAADGQRRGGIPRGIATRGPAILSYGFRPFFLAAGVWAIVSMLAWLGTVAHGWPLGGAYGALNWHAHELLIGYTSAALAGFMLTAIPNWTGRLPVSGTPLGLLAIVWLAGRVAMAAPDTIGLVTAVSIDAAFFPLLGLIAAREIVAGRNWRNLHILVALALLTGANIWFHVAALTDGDTSYAYRALTSVWIMLISLIGGRLAVSFTRNWLVRQGTVTLPASPGLFDRIALASSAAALLFWIVSPEGSMTGLVCLTAAAIHAVRLIRWRGWHAWREPLVLVLHVAYAFIPLGFAVVGAAAFGVLGQTSALHVLTVGAIANMTFAVMTRATRGHTGRPLTAGPMTTLAYATLVLAAFLRPMAALFPDSYMLTINLTGAFWLLAYILFVWEYAPMLVLPKPAKD